MEKKEGEMHEDTQIDDLEAFEEWGESEKEATGAAPSGEMSFSPYEERLPEERPVSEEGKGAGAESTPASPAAPVAYEMADSLINLAPDVPVNLVAVIGKTTTTVGELMKFRMGHVVELGRPPGESVDVVANGRLIARGELVDIDGQLGVRILKMVK